MARKMPKLQTWLVNHLRRISMSWPGKAIARDNARRYVESGTYKNGNPKIKVKWECASCNKLFEREETQMDHIQPAMPLNGFKDWNDYILRLFAQPEGYQCLCTKCHGVKTNAENRKRPNFSRNLTKFKKRAKIRKEHKDNADDIFSRHKRLVSKSKRTRHRVSVRKRRSRKKTIS